jgi:hypothetical protein
MRRTKFLSDRQFLVPGLTDLSEEDLEAQPSPSILPVALFAIVFALGLSLLAFVR